jgi:hypothetical protein
MRPVEPCDLVIDSSHGRAVSTGTNVFTMSSDDGWLSTAVQRRYESHGRHPG